MIFLAYIGKNLKKMHQIATVKQEVVSMPRPVSYTHLGGRSHCPDEWTDYALLQKGAEVLCKTVESLTCGKVGIR